MVVYCTDTIDKQEKVAFTFRDSSETIQSEITFLNSWNVKLKLKYFIKLFFYSFTNNIKMRLRNGIIIKRLRKS